MTDSAGDSNFTEMVASSLMCFHMLMGRGMQNWLEEMNLYQVTQFSQGNDSIWTSQLLSHLQQWPQSKLLLQQADHSQERHSGITSVRIIATLAHENHWHRPGKGGDKAGEIA